MRNLRQVLGDELSPDEAERLARDLFRFRSCDVIDVMRLRGRARSLGKLVEIRGREHLDAALAEGKGAILCSAHFGSYDSAFSLLHASGFPLTTIGRWCWNYAPVCLPPSGGSGTSSTPGACFATGSGRISSRGRAGFRSRCRPQPRSAPMRW